MFTYQETSRYIAQAPGGLEALAAREIEQLGATAVQPGYRAVRFNAAPGVLYRVNYCAKLVTRVLAPLATFTCKDRYALYGAAREIDWTKLFSVHNTFGIFANVSGNDEIRHSNFAALCLKDAIVDQFRAVRDQRPDVDKLAPDIWFNLHIEKDKGTVSLDTSGGSLHKRGYRKETVAAPMQETLAAAMVALSEWDGEKPLYDPMCGSGTLLCEALMHHCRIPSGHFRKDFGFRFLPDFDPTLWLQVKKEADAGIRRLPRGLIGGSDLDPSAIRAARTNCGLLPEGGKIRLSDQDMMDITRLENRVILCNPPYGVRLAADGLPGLYKNLGDFLKQRCTGSDAYIFFGNPEMLKHIGLKPAWKKPLKNAGLDGRLAKYALY